MINKKNSILDAWITIEQLSEGNIKKNDNQYRRFFSNDESREYELLNYMKKEKSKSRFTSRFKEKHGVVIYLGIFSFQIIIDILREKYNIKSTFDDISNTEKFTFALYFDHELRYLPDKLFYTMSGHIKISGDFPHGFKSSEVNYRDKINKIFIDNSFDEALGFIIGDNNFTIDDCCYTYLNDIEKEEVNLHSFYIDEIERAKQINTRNLSRYINGFSGSRKNLDTNHEINKEDISRLLSPEMYPLGRFPSNPKHNLTLMQQIAVNCALHEKNSIQSVNVPPGTGKTTLLKDIFADFVVQQAHIISNSKSKILKKTLTYNNNYKIQVLPSSISNLGIIVASSNNGAVQNIVKDVLQEKEIGSERFSSMLSEIDYFKNISNSNIKEKWIEDENGKKKTIELIKDEELDNWGLFSMEGGKSENIRSLLACVEAVVFELFSDEFESNNSVYSKFLSLYKEVEHAKTVMSNYAHDIEKYSTLKDKADKINSEYLIDLEEKSMKLRHLIDNNRLEVVSLEEQKESLKSKLLSINEQVNNYSEKYIVTHNEYEIEIMQKPNWYRIKKILNSREVLNYHQKLDLIITRLKEYQEFKNRILTEKSSTENLVSNIDKSIEDLNRTNMNKQQEFDSWRLKEEQFISTIKKQVNKFKDKIASNNINHIEFTLDYNKLQKSNFWFEENYRVLQSELFILSLAVRKQFLYENRTAIKSALWIWRNQTKYASRENKEKIIQASWDWINLVIPIISTTFASFSRMFRYIGPNMLGNLFIDEAGQALPQASIGAIFRSKNIFAVGDPSQIEPIMTLDNEVLNLIARNHNVTDCYVSSNVSTQSLIDQTSEYGLRFSDERWIGIPLWVHRRSKDPMFSISNSISYDGLMVQGIPIDKSFGKAKWLHCPGQAKDKYVLEQAELLIQEILKLTKNNPELMDDIYVISPFRNVATQLARKLNSINFTKRENGKAINVGTVHTFQGKEAKIVYFVLGADRKSSGAANWAMSQANIMNVAVTRAKEEFYIIGDRNLYSSLNSYVVNQTLNIIDEYNAN